MTTNTNYVELFEPRMGVHEFVSMRISCVSCRRSMSLSMSMCLCMIGSGGMSANVCTSSFISLAGAVSIAVAVAGVLARNSSPSSKHASTMESTLPQN